MPLLDIATPQPSFRTNLLYSLGFQTLHHVSPGSSSRWRYFHKPNRIIITPTTLVDISSSSSSSRPNMIKAVVATLEPRSSHKEENANNNAPQQHLPPIHDSTTILPAIDNQSSPIQDEKEMLRRKRISKANKGKEAWNKGIQHSPETRQKIRERTKIAMRSPKVKMKLIKAVHSQSQETRLKIGAAVRLTWDRSRMRRRMIARCHREWLNLIAEASRKGIYGEQELQWDSYEIMKEQLEKEHREGMEARKKPKSTPGRRIPKTLEQRKKISEAIAAKWADPAYRDRVYCGIAKRRGKNSESRDPTWGTKKKEAKKIKPIEKKKEPRIRANKLKRISSQARYKDPQAGYKLEMIKSIRAQRAGSDPKIREAVTRANVLIAEAQRAAETLEVAAEKSPMAKASLVETRKLIAEAISYIKSIEMVNNNNNNDSPSSSSSSSPADDVKTEQEQRGLVINGVGSAEIGSKHEDEDNHVVANGKEHIDVSSSSSSSWGLHVEEEDVGRTMASEKEERQGGGKGRRRRRRRWVCGRLVEDDDEQQQQ